MITNVSDYWAWCIPDEPAEEDNSNGAFREPADLPPVSSRFLSEYVESFV